MTNKMNYIKKNTEKKLRHGERYCFYKHITSWDKDWIVMVMVFNTTFNNISFISWRSVLFVGETGVP